MNRFFEVLLCLLVTAKVCDVEPVAQWSWFWVLAPFWAPTMNVIIVEIVVRIGIVWRATWRALKTTFTKPRGEE